MYLLIALFFSFAIFASWSPIPTDLPLKPVAISKMLKRCKMVILSLQLCTLKPSKEITIKELAENSNDNNKKQTNKRVVTDSKWSHEVGGNYEEKMPTKTYCNLQFFLEILGSFKTLGYFLTAKGKSNIYRQGELRGWCIRRTLGLPCHSHTASYQFILGTQKIDLRTVEQIGQLQGGKRPHQGR